MEKHLSFFATEVKSSKLKLEPFKLYHIKKKKKKRIKKCILKH